jgi:ribosomal protein S18 acetylase RimI-like enzyme
MMEDLLINPVYNALLTGDEKFSQGNGNVRYFDEQVSPFVGFHHEYENGFDDLYQELPAGRKILHNTTKLIPEPKGWQVLAAIQGVQFVFEGEDPGLPSRLPIPLDSRHADEMVALADLTKPGPFGKRTIEFGHYHGIFDNGKLVAMTGQRLHVGPYTELSAVCTHPAHLGKGYAASLMTHQLNLILSQGQRPFLHVRADNVRAIALYERLGFKANREMNFYFMKRKDG